MPRNLRIDLTVNDDEREGVSVTVNSVTLDPPEEKPAVDSEEASKRRRELSRFKYYETDDGITVTGFKHLFTGACLTIPDGVKAIGEYAFNDMPALQTVILPEGVEVIGDSAFANCPHLDGIYIPESVISIGKKAFSGCSSLKIINLPGVVSIGSDAFSFCSRLCMIYIPDGVRYMGDSAFFRCISLTYCRLPASLLHIGNFAFFGCKALRNIEFAGSREKWNLLTSGIDIGFNKERTLCKK